MYFSCQMYDSYVCFLLLLYFKFITDSPDGAETPAIVILDLLADTLDMHIYGTGIADIFIAPDLIQ